MKKLLSKMNLSLLGLTILYSILGCIMIYSASSVLTVLKQGVASNYYFLRQVAILIISIFVTIIVTRFPLGSYKYFSYPLVIGIGASLVGLLLAGKITNGTNGKDGVTPKFKVETDGDIYVDYSGNNEV